MKRTLIHRVVYGKWFGLGYWGSRKNNFRAPLKTVLFRDGGVSRVLKSSCIRPYTPVFRARLPCPHKKCLVFRGALPMFGRRSIPSGGVARPFHTRSMRSPRALPDRRLSTPTEEVIHARTLKTLSEMLKVAVRNNPK